MDNITGEKEVAQIMNERFNYFLTTLIGCESEVITKSGVNYGGITKAIHPDDLHVTLDLVSIVKNESGKGLPPVDPYSMAMIKGDQLLCLSAKNVEYIQDKAVIVPREFMTDSAISKSNTHSNKERILEKVSDTWISNDDVSLDGINHNIGEWDQFTANEKLTGHVAEFDELQYTTPLDPNLSEESIRRAEKLAKEIENNKNSNNPHVLEDRGILKEVDEAALYSDVNREIPTQQQQQQHQQPAVSTALLTNNLKHLMRLTPDTSSSSSSNTAEATPTSTTATTATSTPSTEKSQSTAENTPTVSTSATKHKLNKNAKEFTPHFKTPSPATSPGLIPPQVLMQQAIPPPPPPPQAVPVMLPYYPQVVMVPVMSPPMIPVPVQPAPLQPPALPKTKLKKEAKEFIPKFLQQQQQQQKSSESTTKEADASTPATTETSTTSVKPLSPSPSSPSPPQIVESQTTTTTNTTTTKPPAALTPTNVVKSYAAITAKTGEKDVSNPETQPKHRSSIVKKMRGGKTG